MGLCSGIAFAEPLFWRKWRGRIGCMRTVAQWVAAFRISVTSGCKPSLQQVRKNTRPTSVGLCTIGEASVLAACFLRQLLKFLPANDEVQSFVQPVCGGRQKTGSLLWAMRSIRLSFAFPEQDQAPHLMYVDHQGRSSDKSVRSFTAWVCRNCF